VNLRQGLPQSPSAETCTAGAGSLVLEFGLLSRLLGDPVYEGYARRANKVLWNLRAKSTGLLGVFLICWHACTEMHVHVVLVSV